MKTRVMIWAIFAVITVPCEAIGQLRYEIIKGDSISIYSFPSRVDFALQVDASVIDNSSHFVYSYALSNDELSPQSVQSFDLFFCTNENPTVLSPPAWHGASKLRVTADFPFVYWAAKTEDGLIASGETRVGFSLESPSLPAILQYHSTGYIVLPTIPDYITPDSIEYAGDQFLVGNTIGPSSMASQLSLITFLDTLTTYPQRSFDEGWLSDSQIVSKLETQLLSIQASLQSEEEVRAATKLVSLLALIESEKESSLTSEAYALFKYNLEFILNKLRT